MRSSLSIGSRSRELTASCVMAVAPLRESLKGWGPDAHWASAVDLCWLRAANFLSAAVLGQESTYQTPAHGHA